jgi:hypothetical protein
MVAASSRRRRTGVAGPSSGLRIAPRNGTNYAESGGKTQVGRFVLVAAGGQEHCRRAMKEVTLALQGGCCEVGRWEAGDED